MCLCLCTGQQKASCNWAHGGTYSSASVPPHPFFSVCVSVCCSMHVHISIQTIFAIHSSLPRALSQSLPTYTALFLFSSVHCFGLQLLYLFRLTGGLALPLGFRMGNGVAEKWVDNRDRQGLDHPHYPPPTKEKKKRNLNEDLLPKK